MGRFRTEQKDDGKDGDADVKKRRSFGGLGPEHPLKHNRVDPLAEKQLKHHRESDAERLKALGTEACNRLVLKNRQNLPAEYYVPVTALGWVK